MNLAAIQTHVSDSQRAADTLTHSMLEFHDALHRHDRSAQASHALSAQVALESYTDALMAADLEANCK